MKTIQVQNLDLFEQSLLAVARIVPSVKLMINQTGLIIHSCNSFARISLFTNSVSSQEDLSLCLKDVTSLIKIIKLIKDEDKKKTSINVEMSFDDTFLYIKSANVKTKINTVKEEVIQNVISKEVTVALTPIFEFKTSSDLLKKVASNSFIFSDPESIRVYLNQHEDMQHNTLYAEITNKTNKLSNNIVTKIGDITLGKLDHDLIVDFERLKVFDIFKSDNITIQLMDKPFLVSNLNISKDLHFIKVTVYNSLRKN